MSRHPRADRAFASDARLTADVIAELKEERVLRHEQIKVRADDGVVTLSGYVASFAMKQAADRAVLRVPGVTSLSSEVAVRRDALVQVPIRPSVSIIALRDGSRPAGSIDGEDLAAV